VSTDRISTIWIPSVLGAAFLLFGLALPRIWSTLPPWTTLAGVICALLLWCLALYLAFQRLRGERARGGGGGSAIATGEESRATGGPGGDAGHGNGGDGGAAVAKGARSIAKGGPGGKG
jgi:hypothetical protein